MEVVAECRCLVKNKISLLSIISKPRSRVKWIECKLPQQQLSPNIAARAARSAVRSIISEMQFGREACDKLLTFVGNQLGNQGGFFFSYACLNRRNDSYPVCNSDYSGDGA